MDRISFPIYSNFLGCGRAITVDYTTLYGARFTAVNSATTGFPSPAFWQPELTKAGVKVIGLESARIAAFRSPAIGASVAV
jgi:hypothetical protein